MTEPVDVENVESSDDEEDNIQVDAIIWTDTTVTVEEENQKAHQELQNLFKDTQVLVFQQSSDCEQYVREHADNSFLIIVSRQLAQELVVNIHNFENIKSIYIYCRTENWNEEWMQNFIKVNHIIHI